MALKLINTIASCFAYELDTGPPPDNPFWWANPVCHPELVEPPRIYKETVSSLGSFFYDPVKDVYVALARFNFAYLPGWSVARLVWNADGSQNDEYTTRSTPPTALAFWTGSISVGGFDKFYGATVYLDVREIDWVTGVWPGWKTCDWAGHPIPQKAIVNRQDGIVAIIGTSPVLNIYDYDAQELLGQIAIIDTGASMAYESDSHLWIIHKAGQVAKVNYKTYRHELLSAVNTTPEDIAFKCAFDTNRNRLVILRHLPDATDGACQLQLEFYNPVPQAQIITDPIPVNSLNDEKITFAGHVLGDAGEGISSQAVTAAIEDPAAGKLTSGRVVTGPNGSYELEYGVVDDNPAETMTVSIEV